MKKENQQLHKLRTLVVKSQHEPLSETEIVELNALVHAEGGASEAVALIDQLCAFTDSGSMDSLPVAEVLSQAFGENGMPSMNSADAGIQNGAGSAVPKPNMFRRNPLGESSNQWPGYYWLLALAASHLLIASLAWSWAKSSPAVRSAAELTWEATVPHAETRARQPVSTAPQLVSMTACIWRPSSDLVHAVGEPIQSGEILDLVEGIAELRIGEGTSGEALVRIEGPARVFVLADGQLGLRHGSLTAKSLGTGSGNVTVMTPVGKVTIDGQSSIGLVSNEFVNEVHLFTGQAVVDPILTSSMVEVLRLEAGDAVRFSSKSGEKPGVVMFEASMSSFVSARSSGFDPLNLGEEYVKAVLDSQPSIYWRFEELSSDDPLRVENLGNYPDMDGVVIGEPAWRRYGNNRVAELGKIGSSSAFRSTGLWPPKPLDEYTIEMWIKPELYHHGEMFCLHESEQKDDGRYSHTLMFECMAQHWHNPYLENLQPNRLRFVHRTPASGEVSEGSNLVTEQQYQVRTWQHLVAQKQRDRVLLWVDGKLSAEQHDSSPLNANMRFVMGQLYSTRPERRYVGQFDEVAIYDRCLPQEELQLHINAAGRNVSAVEAN